MRERALVAVLLLATLGACASQMQPEFLGPQPEWVGAFTTAQSAAASGDFLRADSVLVAYSRAHPGTPEAMDAVFWRGVFALDPANPRGSAAVGAAAFEEYLGDPGAVLRRVEATVLARVASKLDSLTAAGGVVAARPPGADAARVDADPRDEELRRLREELRRANEELERIRRRLATPARPDPPPPDQGL